MRKTMFLVAAPWIIVLATLLVACGTDAGPALQFDAIAYEAATEAQSSDAAAAAVESPEAGAMEEAATAPDVAKKAAPVYISDSAWAGHVSHEEIVQLVRSEALSSSRMTDPVVMKWRYVPKLAPSSAEAAAVFPVFSDAVQAAPTGQATDSAVASAVLAAAQPSLDTPDSVLQNASFTLVTVETNGVEQVILMPSEDYTKVCPHRLRMASEFNDFGTADF